MDEDYCRKYPTFLCLTMIYRVSLALRTTWTTREVFCFDCAEFHAQILAFPLTLPCPKLIPKHISHEFATHLQIILSTSHSSAMPRLRLKHNSCGIFAKITGMRNVPYVSIEISITCKLRTADSILSKSCRSYSRSLESIIFGSCINNFMCFEMITSSLPKRFVRRSTPCLNL